MAATMATATETAAATVMATTTTHADAAMDIKDETTEDTKAATMDTKDADAVVDAAKDVNAQEQRHYHESIAGPTVTAPTMMALNAATKMKVTSTVPPMATGKAAATTSATVPVAG